MGTPNFANRTLFHGDNLNFLRGMNSGTVQLIATDPPFNKNRDFAAVPTALAKDAKFEDRWRWERDAHQDWIDAIQDDWPAVWAVIDWSRLTYGDDMGAFLCWLGVRLLEMHRVLREDGSLYLHCDDTAAAYLKTLMDAIFGRANYRNTITWERTTSRSDGVRWRRTSDTILFYTKSDTYTWHDQFAEGDPVHAGKTMDLTGPGISAGASGQPWRGWDPGSIGRCWSVPRKGKNAKWIEENHIPGYRTIVGIHDRLDALEKAGLIRIGRTGSPRLAIPAEAKSGAKINVVWTDIPAINSQSDEATGYPTQKPLDLYERIIKASSNEGDFVLDPFCGCATTPVAAENLRRQWVGIDIWDKAHETVLNRLESVGLGDRPIRVAQVGYSSAVPVRSDDGDTASPPLKTTKKRIKEPPGPKMTRAEMVAILIEENGLVCAGCDREFDDPLYLELDHNTPRSDGGLNHISNRLLLCGPCNRIKGNRLTLSGLRAENKRRGRMATKG